MRNIYLQGCTTNRDLSWLRYDYRILEEGRDQSVPLLERLNYIRIAKANLDEFIKVRIPKLLESIALGPEDIDSKSGLTMTELLNEIVKDINQLNDEAAAAYLAIIDALRDHHIDILSYAELLPEERDIVDRKFRSTIAPLAEVRTGTMSDIKELPGEENIFLASIPSQKHSLIILTFPASMPKVLVIGRGKQGVAVIPTEEVVKAYFHELIRPFEGEECNVVRIIRAAGSIGENVSEILMDMEDSADLTEVMHQEGRIAACEIVYSGDREKKMAVKLSEALSIPKGLVMFRKGEMPFDLDCINDVYRYAPENIIEELSYSRHEFVNLYENKSIISEARKRDILLAHPYESLEPVIRLIEEAADSEDTEAINITVYRMDENSELMEALAKASLRGVKVRVLMELRARFSEQSNLDIAGYLEERGVKVFYSEGELKVHAKMLQIVQRRDDGRHRYITHIGTGNYSVANSARYTDFSLITCNYEIGRDIHRLFKAVRRGQSSSEELSNRSSEFRSVLVSPYNMKQVFLDLIDNEIDRGGKGRIFIKCNAVTDSDIIDRLIEASNSGVKIRMIVRSSLGILPGIEDATENIEIVNVVGRYLEHSRVYVFGSGSDEVMYISSADLMSRNLERRIEIACPINDSRIRNSIKRIIKLNYRDDIKGRRMNSSGEWVPKETEGGINSQERIAELYSR